MLHDNLLSHTICKSAVQQGYAPAFKRAAMPFFLGWTQQGWGGYWGLIDITTLADIGLLGF